MAKKKQEFAVMLEENYSHTIIKIVQAVDAEEAQRIGESMKITPNPKKLSLTGREVFVLGPDN